MSDMWQPISTAPKDGTRILVAYSNIRGNYDPGYKIEIAYWSNCFLWGVEKNFHWTVRENHNAMYSFGLVGDNEPFCWQPLPELPQKVPT